MDKYSWSFDRDAEIWCAGESTIRKCLAAAKEATKEYGVYNKAPSVVYIGENILYTPSVDAEDILDKIAEDAWDFAGEAAEGWDAYNSKKQDELDELSEQITKNVKQWLKKYKYEPNFCAIQNIRKYSLIEEGAK